MKDKLVNLWNITDKIFNYISGYLWNQLKRIGRNWRLFLLILIKVILDIGVITFITKENETALGVLATVVVYVIFNLCIHKNEKEKRYNVKKWSVWNECSLVTIGVFLFIYYTIIESNTETRGNAEFLDFRFPDFYNYVYMSHYVDDIINYFLTLLIIAMMYLILTWGLLKIFKDKENT